MQAFFFFVPAKGARPQGTTYIHRGEDQGCLHMGGGGANDRINGKDARVGYPLNYHYILNARIVTLLLPNVRSAIDRINGKGVRVGYSLDYHCVLDASIVISLFSNVRLINYKFDKFLICTILNSSLCFLERTSAHFLGSFSTQLFIKQFS